mmetsp:Transcript_49762/g.128022  ORF Transcript_49762/g.128022 Transcript_49762/m.128022 type:complete len:615 (-) Transcript_49762:310-2154(-)
MDRQRTVRFKSPDAIQNFRVRVEVARAPGEGQAELMTTLGGEKDLKSMLASAFAETAVVSWQEKLFSPSEFQHYLTMPLDNTLDEKYKTEIEAMDEAKKEKLFAPVCLCTVTNQDILEGSFLGREVLPRTIQATTVFEPGDEEHITPLAEVVDMARTSKSSRADGLAGRLVKAYNHQSFLIIAAVRQYNFDAAKTKEDQGVKFEQVEDLNLAEKVEMAKQGKLKWNHTVLCSLKVYDNGNIDMTPGFTSNQQRYTFVSASGLAYAFKLENYASTRNDKLTSDAIDAMIRPKAEVGDFEQPLLDGRVKVYARGEIIGTKGFDVSSLYVQHYVQPSEDWTASDGTRLTCCTQLGRTKKIESNGETIRTVHLSFPLQLEFVGERLRNMPQVFFQVCSYDFWDRVRLHGYGYWEVPKRPGYYDVTIPCWRPQPSLGEQVREFYVGGAKELQDIRFVALPVSSSQKRLSKFGFNTEGTGEIHIRMSVTMMAKANVERYYLKKEMEDRQDEEMASIMQDMKLRKERANKSMEAILGRRKAENSQQRRKELLEKARARVMQKQKEREKARERAQRGGGGGRRGSSLMSGESNEDDANGGGGVIRRRVAASRRRDDDDSESD